MSQLHRLEAEVEAVDRAGVAAQLRVIADQVEQGYNSGDTRLTGDDDTPNSKTSFTLTFDYHYH